MKPISMAFALSALLITGACANDQKTASNVDTTSTTAVSAGTPVTQQADLTPEELGALGAEIKKNPNDAKRLLSQRGLDDVKFEQAVRKVSEDPDASRRYAESYKKAGA